MRPSSSRTSNEQQSVSETAGSALPLTSTAPSASKACQKLHGSDPNTSTTTLEHSTKAIQSASSNTSITLSNSGSSGWTSGHSDSASGRSCSESIPSIESDDLGDALLFDATLEDSTPRVSSSPSKARLSVADAVSDLQASSSSLRSSSDSKTKKKKKKKSKKDGERKPRQPSRTLLMRCIPTDDEAQSVTDPEALQLLHASSKSIEYADSDASENNTKENTGKVYTNLHKYIRKYKWDKLREAVEFLQKEGNDHHRRSALTKSNKYGETTLHVAAWSAPVPIVKVMLQLVPVNERSDYLVEVDNNGNTVVHFACASLEHLDEFAVCKEIVLMAPEAILMQNRDGDTPLHLLVSSKAFRRSTDFKMEAVAEDLITSLLKLSKNAGKLLNQEAATLLHVAIASGAHERVLMRLIQHDPESLAMADEQGMLPIHYLAAFGANLPWTVAQDLVLMFPDCLVHLTNKGDTPLHVLMDNADKFLNDKGVLDRNTTKLAELLVGTSTGSTTSPLMTRNHQEMTPLHILALRDTPPQLTRLLMSCPGAEYATAVTSEFGATPMHLACASPNVSERLETLEALASSKACSTFDAHGRTPLVIAAQNENANSDVVALLLEVYPRAATMPCRSGHLPVHLAVQRSSANVAVVRLLLSVHPKIARATNAKGNTPLHEAVIHGAPIAVLALLLEKFPDAIQEVNKIGQRPYNCAQQVLAPPAVLDLLDETTMSATQTVRARRLSFASSVAGGTMAEF